MMTNSGKPLARRSFLKASGAALASLAVPHRWGRSAESEARVPARQLTHGPKFHWFSYYDKYEFDPSNRFLLGMEVDFEHRSPKPEDGIRVGMIDLEDGDRWIELGRSTAWCWQQGCMLQWRPGSATEVLWNDRDGNRYVCRILDVKSRALRTIRHPIYCTSPDGRWAIAPDFRRLADTRPGYGYNGIPDPYRDEIAPKDSGIWRIDLDSGEQKLIVSLADIAKISYAHGDFSKSKQWFNHLLVNTDGSRIEFLHRWRTDKNAMQTRMFTARPDGSDLRVLIGSGSCSHFIWRDPSHVLAYSKPEPKSPWGFFLYEDRPGGKVEHIGRGVMYDTDGHCSYLPGNRWVLCDTYPDRERRQNLYLFDTVENRRVELGGFTLPKEYSGEWRCDLHPRFSRDGRRVVIDSPHTGQGRQLHAVDISGIIG